METEPNVEVEKEPTTGLPLGDINQVGGVFKYLDGIGEPKLKREKTKTQKPHASQSDRNLTAYVDFLAQLNPFMTLIQSLHKYSMATIFYTRMVQAKTILSEVQMKRYKQLFILYLDLIEQIPEDTRQKMNTTAVDLLHHLHTHTIDPDSAIVGLNPTDDVVSKVSARDAGDTVNYTREAVVNEVLKWSSLQDAEEVKRNVRTLAASLRGVDKLKMGEIVVVKAPSRVSFARISSERASSSGNVHVFFDPMEATAVSVDGWCIYPLTRQILDSMRDVKKMEKLIKQNTEGFFSSLHQDVKMRIFNSLSDIGMDLTLIQRATDLQTSVLDLEDLRKASARLTELADNPSGGIFKSSEEYMRAKVDEYIAQMDKIAIFMPKYDETMDQLYNYYQLPLARSRIRQLQGACDLAIDNLSLEMRKLLNGTRKAEITEWWLKLIETTVNEFLRVRKYEFSAVPDNYIERPPADVELVRKNLDIVQCILDPAAPPETSPVDLIAELQGKVYPVIDDFMKKALVALSEALSTPISHDLNGLREKLSSILATVEQVKPTIQPTLAEQLLDMVHDLEYLCEMKRLEYSQGEKSLHIVPVCGLVMGTFVRLENELKTVIELWDDKEMDLEPTVERIPEETDADNGADSTAVSNLTGGDEDIVSPPVEETSASELDEAEDGALEETSLQQGQSPLHRAVCTDKLKSVLKILANADYAKSLVNVPNAKGWTPLHMACLLGNFEICNKLLEIEGVDVSCKTEDGTTPLHFLVRHPASEAQLSVLNKLLELGTPVNVSNRHGETPLHGASLKGNVAAVEILISRGADLDAITIGGEAPIHYAVTGGAVPVVEVLLDAGADPTLPAQRGTPLELAHGYKNEQIVMHLRASVGPLSDRGWPRTTRTPPGMLLVPEVSGGYDEAMRNQIRIGTRRRKSLRKSRSLHPDPASDEVITPFTPVHIAAALQLSPPCSPPQEHAIRPPASETPLPQESPAPTDDNNTQTSNHPRPPSLSSLNQDMSTEASPPVSDDTETTHTSPIQINSGRSQTVHPTASPSTEFMFPLSWRAAKSPANIGRTAFLNRNLLREGSQETLQNANERHARKLKSDSDNTGFARKHSSTTPVTLTSVSAPAHTAAPISQLTPNTNADRPLPTPPVKPGDSSAVPGKNSPAIQAKQQPKFTSVNRFAPVALLGMNDLSSVKLKPAGGRLPKDRADRSSTTTLVTMVTPVVNRASRNTYTPKARPPEEAPSSPTLPRPPSLATSSSSPSLLPDNTPPAVTIEPTNDDSANH